jgi:hypothetical protein
MADKSTQKAVENTDRSPFSTLKTFCPALCRQEAVQRSLWESLGAQCNQRIYFGRTMRGQVTGQ